MVRREDRMEQPNIEQPGFRTILARAMVAPLIIMALLAGVLLWQIDSYRAATRAVIRSDRTIAQANQFSPPLTRSTRALPINPIRSDGSSRRFKNTTNGGSMPMVCLSCARVAAIMRR
jgi:hypothetical protein